MVYKGRWLADEGGCGAKDIGQLGPGGGSSDIVWSVISDIILRKWVNLGKYCALDLFT